MSDLVPINSALEQINKSALDKFAFSAEELIKDVDAAQVNRGQPQRRQVCICGHSFHAHKISDTGEKTCRPNSRTCHCKDFLGVLETTNLRVFMRFSMGNGTLHALSQGIRALMEKGGLYHWLPDVCFCHKCKRTDAKIVPVLLSKDGYRIDFSIAAITNRTDIFLCEDCYFDFEKTGTVRGE